MANLTPQEATNLSDYLADLNKSIEDYRYDKTKNLSDSQKQAIDDYIDQISNAAQDLLALSTNLVMNEVQASLTQLESVTTQINTTLKTLTDIQKVINIAASVATLGSAIISEDPKGIGNAITGLVTTWKT
jgi:hypothetical protein